MKQLDNLPLQRLVKIDQKIATADQVESRERRVTRYIVLRKDTEIPNLLGYLVVIQA
jgi:hypothetical protein